VIAAGTALVTLGCASPVEPPPETGCTLSGKPTLTIGRFSDQVEPISPGEGIDVWIPTQGGIVIGFNAITHGTGLKADKLETRFVESKPGGATLVDGVEFGVKFPCEPSGVRMRSYTMVQLEPGLDFATLDGRAGTLTVKATFKESSEGLVTLVATHEGHLRALAR